MTNSKVKVATITNVEKNLFYMFFVVAILLLGSYLYLVNMSVLNIVAREKTQVEIGRLTTLVASQESEYLALANREVTVDYARSLGFKEVTSGQGYAVPTKKTVTLSLLSTNEI